MADAAGGVRRGNLRQTLLEHGIALVRASGPEAVSLRDVQRRAGVSNSAAYRHYADREALLVAVAAYASAEMARTMEREMAQVTASADPVTTAMARFRATGNAYLRFALAEPGLFAVAFMPEAHADKDDEPSPDARGDSGLGPFQLLERCVDDLVEVGALAPERRAGTDVAAWASVHGLATLLLSGPLVRLDRRGREQVIARLLDLIEDGIR